MLTDEKRKKLLAGTLIAVMLTGVAGCGNGRIQGGRGERHHLRLYPHRRVKGAHWRRQAATHTAGQLCRDRERHAWQR